MKRRNGNSKVERVELAHCQLQRKKGRRGTVSPLKKNKAGCEREYQELGIGALK